LTVDYLELVITPAVDYCVASSIWCGGINNRENTGIAWNNEAVLVKLKVVILTA
jgi:hypothetical protein